MITLALEIGLLMLAKYLWFIYFSTSLYENFTQMHPLIARMFQEVFQTNLFLQGGQASLIAAVVVFLFGIAGRLTHINRFFFRALWFFRPGHIMGVAGNGPYSPGRLAPRLVE